MEGRILAAGGAKDAAAAVLAQVEREAAARGFSRIAREAREARGA
jgi:hypothetical protein